MWDLLNCYISPRNRIQKRPGVRDILDGSLLDAVTVGLWPFNLNLWTLAGTDLFQGVIQPPAATDPEVWTLVLEHGKTVNRVHYVGVLLGGLYIVIEYDELTPAIAARGGLAQSVQKGVIEHYYVVTDASAWEADSVFTQVSPVGLRVVPTAAVDDVAKVIRLDYYYEATELNSPAQGGIEPVWPTSAGATVTDGDLIWNTVTLHNRLNTAETFDYHPDGVYCIPTERQTASATTRAWKAINIREGDTLNASTNRSGQGVVFDLTLGATTIDGEIIWETIDCKNWAVDAVFPPPSFPTDPIDANNDYAYALPSVQTAYDFIYVGTWLQVSTGATEPVWPTTPGETVEDGQITWKTVQTLVTDTRCPNGPEVLVHQSKVYGIGSNLPIQGTNMDSLDETDIVRYSATNDPFDWSTPDDAGFIAVGVQSTGSEVAKALGKYDNQLAVLMEDNVQIWAVDPDPERNALIRSIGDIGVSLSETVANIGTDLIYLSDSGFRSISQQIDTVNLEDTDLGSPVDDPVVAAVATAVGTPTAAHFSGLGQYLCAVDNELWAWTWSRNAEVIAWSRYEVPLSVDYFAQLTNRLFMRGLGGELVHLDPATKTDYTGDYPVLMDFDYQSLQGGVGVTKQFMGFDVNLIGEAEVTFKYDPRHVSRETSPITMAGNTRPGGMAPMECTTPEIAPIIRYTGPDDLRVDSITIYYENLGVIS